LPAASFFNRVRLRGELVGAADHARADPGVEHVPVEDVVAVLELWEACALLTAR
jgi:hypothetical protein